jgi:FlaG/FlaF family flagellin (archaellin)
MVAITVVLAAVLYVMVMGMTPDDTDVTPAGSWGAKDLTSTTAKINYGTLGADVKPKDMKLVLEGNGTTLSFTIGEDLTSTSTNPVIMDPATGTITIAYTDLSIGGNDIGSGDYITISGLTAGTSYTIKQFYIPTDEAMTGGETTFQTAP